MKKAYAVPFWIFMFCIYIQVGVASDVFFADKSSDDRVFDLFGGLTFGKLLFCRGSSF